MTVKKLSIGLTALLLAACTPASPPESASAPAPSTTTDVTAGLADPGQAPALWRVSDEDTTVWLFGTIHMLPSGFEWRNPAIDAAIASSDELVLETVMSGEQSESALLLMQLGITPGLPPIGERVPEEVHPQLAAMIARGPFPESFLNGLETWAAALMLVGVTLNDLGLDSESGVEEQLEQIFNLAHKRVTGLETPAQQLGYFDTLPEDAQRNFLATVIDAPDDVRAEFQAMLNAWITGDEAAIAETFDSEMAEFAALRAALLTNRNARWAQWVGERLDRPGTVFLAVGAGHLAGGESVQDFLSRAGLEVVRVQ
ncbi:TraB/GumN family protein [Parasphingopyxis marina]|uniref:TraB/GumN family protein n=1 Tax=Parasphingopyxis marina TaxID=2761622 RepID=A0A842HZU5_9SPHN|nr:TraB/GumN family protein [Parasphingopyxis marina]MBC2777460.1 TraB/GumN family protein [Parasphingopyxis marina]